MSPLKKISIAMFVYSLVACGDSDLPEPDVTLPAQQQAMQQEKVTMKANPHTLQGMKNVMEDAKGVENMLQEHEDQRQKKINEMLQR